MVNHYLILENIGEGSYAKVKLASRRLIGIEQKYALKIFSKTRKFICDECRENSNNKFKDLNKIKANKRIICDICSVEYSYSGSSNHKKIKIHIKSCEEKMKKV